MEDTDGLGLGQYTGLENLLAAYYEPWEKFGLEEGRMIYSDDIFESLRNCL